MDSGPKQISLDSDWHVHTHYSDGLASVEDVVRRASGLGLTRIAITDHDCIEAHIDQKFVEFGQAHQVYIVPGVEIDCCLGDKETEILGFGFDANNPDLKKRLALVQQDRTERFDFLCRGLAEQGEPIEPGSVLSPFVKTPIKVHLYRALAKQGRTFEAGYKEFKALLDDLGPAPPVNKPGIEEAVELIKRAGGYSLLAHPLFFAERIGLDRLFDAGRAAGCAGLELFYPYEFGEKGLDIDRVRSGMRQIMELAGKYFPKGAEASRGTDVHDLDEWKERLASVRTWEETFLPGA
ncbi:MAG: PHP domain-containing protein [Deltaproteobacteria bacterium]|nr:PHP domain-containing protein [Deltaproteobacteria bacterium]